MQRLRLLLVVFALVATATPAFACETEPDLVRLPGETDAAFEARSDKTHKDQWVIRRYLRETNDFEKASAVYVARVVEQHREQLPPEKLTMPWAVVQPLHPIKGSLPASNRKLSVTALWSCGPYGDGDAALSPAGTLVFVFEGLPKSEARPNGIDSIRTTDARTFELLDPFYQQFGNKDSPGS